MNRFALFCCFLSISWYSQAQTNFRTLGSGNGTGLWSNIAIWQMSSGASWVAANRAPSSVEGTILIQTGDVVTVSSDVAIDQTTISAGGSVLVSGATLTLTGGGNALILKGSLSTTATGTVLFSGESFMNSTGTFTNDGTIKLESANGSGALITGGGAGNIRISGARTYNSGSKVVYSGSSAQIMGNGHPTTAGVITEINNSNGISFTTAATGNAGTVMNIPGNLILTSGNFHIVSTSTARSLTLNGSVVANSNNIAFSGINTSLVINGSTSFGSFPFAAGAQTIRNFTLNLTSGLVTFNNAISVLGTTTITSGNVTFNGTTTLTGSVTVPSGSVIAFDGQSLSMAGNFTSSGHLSASGASTLTLTGATALTSALNFVSTNKTLQSLTINKTNASGTSVQIGSSGLNVTNSLTLTKGTLDIANSLNMNNGSSLNFSSGSSIISNSPSGGPWNLSYSGSTLTTGLEIPASGSLISLTSSNTGTITLNKALLIGTGGLTQNGSGNFKSGAFAISTPSLAINAGTFTAPSSTLTLTGDISVAGAYSNNSGTLIFAGNSAQSITGSNIANVNFFGITINNGATVNAPSVLNWQGQFINNGTFNANNGTAVFKGTSSSISGSTNTQFYNFNVNGTGILTINTHETVTNGLTLTTGTLAITGSLLTVQSTASITRAAGSISTSSPTGSGWNLIYTGASKSTGLEIPASGDVGQVTVNTNATTSITLKQKLSASKNLIISSGNTFTSGNNNLTVDSLINNGTFGAPTNIATTGLTLNGSLVNNGMFNVNNGTVLVNSAGTFSGTLPTFNNLTVNPSGVFTSTQDIALQGNFKNDGTFNAGSNTVNFTGASVQSILGASNTQFNNLTVNKTSSVTINSAETIKGDLNLTAGTLNISSPVSITGTASHVNINSGTLNVTASSSVTGTSSVINLTAGTLAITANRLSLANGSTINVVAGTITTSNPSGGPWNLIYSGSAAVNPPGFEIPTSGSLQSFQSTNSNAITLNRALSVGAGGITLNSATGSIVCGTNTVSTGFLTITAGTFNAPSTTLALTSGDLTINGTYVPNGGVLIFGGTTSQTIAGSGATTTNFNSIKVNSLATFTAPSALIVTGNLQNDGTLTAGSGTISFTGSNAQSISGSSNTQFKNIIVNKTVNPLGFASAETITGDLTLTAGTINFSSSVSITGTSSQVNINSGTLNVTASSSITGTASVINLTSGTLSITGSLLSLANGSTINVVAGTISTSSPSGGPWNLTYSGSTAVNPPGFEIPTSGSLQSLLSTNSNAITLNRALSVGAGGITLNSSTGSIVCGTNTVSTGFLTITAGTFNAPSSTLTLTSSDLTINGVYTPNGGTLVFGGTASQTITGPGATTTNFNSITVNNLATFAPAASLTVLGTLQNDGTFSAGTGTVTFSNASSSATAQIAGGSKITFYNITVVNGTAGTDLILENSAGADLINILNVGTSTFDADGALGNRVFTLLSTSDTPTTDASIGIITTGAVTGNVTAQRYMSRSGVAQYDFQVWRDISSPVNSTVSDLQNFLPVTGVFTNASPTPSGGTPGVASMVSYNEAIITDVDGNGRNDFNDGFSNFPPDNGSNTAPFSRGQGYSMFIFGSDAPVSTNGNAKWSLTGPIWSGAFSLPVTYTSSGKVANDGWNLIGNPYPSTIDWKAASGWTKTHVNDAVYIDNYSSATPVFASYVNGVGANGGSRYIAMGQGFWVKAGSASPALAISESVKVPGVQTTFIREAAPQNLVRVTLASADQQKDETVIYFADNTTDEFDGNYDAIKLNNRNGYINLSSLSPSRDKYAINALSLAGTCAKNISLDVSNVVSGTYSLSFSQLESVNSSIKVQLNDSFSNSTIDVRQNQNYSFEVDLKNALTYGSSRFSLVFSYSGSIIPIVTQSSAVCNPALAQVLIKNSLSDFNYSLLSGVDGTTVVPGASGSGADLKLLIPASALLVGENKFIVQQSNKLCSGLSSSSQVSVTYLSTPEAPSVKSNTICGKGVITLAATGAPNDGHYLWYDSIIGGNAYSNQSSDFITGSLAKSRTYYVSAVNSLGCEGQRSAVHANIVDLDPAEITVTDLYTITSNYEKGNQWYFNDNLIVGATDKMLKITQSGDYKLTVTQGGCTTSVDKELIGPSDLNESISGINAYPNPVRGKLTVEATGNDKATGDLYNSIGVLISNLEFSASDDKNQSATYNFSNTSGGVYFIKINQGNKSKVIRIVKD